MNIERMKLLRDTIAEAPEHKFDMEAFFKLPEGEGWSMYPIVRDKILAGLEQYHCQTAACIGGFAAILGWTRNETEETEVENAAMDWLDLDQVEACHLFVGRWAIPLTLGEITRDMALEELDRLIAKAETEERNAHRS